MDSQPQLARRSRWPILVVAGLAILVGIGALVFVLTRGPGHSRRPRAAAARAVETPAAALRAAGSSGYTITSTNPKVKVALLADLPQSPGSADGDCDEDYAAVPKSAGARVAAAKGWLIADEARLGPLTAVAVASSFETSTSSFCFADNGNVALFDDDRLVAIVYAPRGANEQIGGFQTVGDALRIGTSGPEMPLGDLTLSGRAIRFGAFAASDTVCSGRRRVPSIYGLTIAAARRKLIANGWKPVPSRSEVAYFAADLRKQGIVEVSDCLPTGYGQCSFDYVAGADRLNVGSIGDSPESVTGYSASCG